MANNRLYLLHKESGVAVKLGKTMIDGWYDAPAKETLEEFYDFLRREYGEMGDTSSAFEVVCEEIGFDKIDRLFKNGDWPNNHIKQVQRAT